MHGIYLALLITATLALAIFGTLLQKLPLRAQTRLLWFALGIALPLQPLAFYLVRVPADHWLAGHLGVTSGFYLWVTSFYAPVTEELAKLMPLLIPAIRRDIRSDNFVRYALAIGLGFALGEMAFLAERIARTPSFAAIPFYQFTGYATERLLTCVFHTAFVSVALWRLRRGFALGVLGAIALHWLGNAPLFLLRWNLGGLGRNVWLIIVQFWLLGYCALLAAMLAAFAFGRLPTLNALYGRRKCPGCQGEYDAPLFALNFGRTRYERCPHCRRWHWTRRAAF
jgi:hypothetical protein